MYFNREIPRFWRNPAASTVICHVVGGNRVLQNFRTCLPLLNKYNVWTHKTVFSKVTLFPSNWQSLAAIRKGKRKNLTENSLVIYTGCNRRNGPDFGRVFILYRYNPKHLYPKFNGYGDIGQRSLKLWQLLLTYWLSNTYWNWQEYVVSVVLIYVHNIKVTCEWHKAIK